MVAKILAKTVAVLDQRILITNPEGVKLETPIVLGAKKCKERSSKRGNSERENNETSLARSVDKDIT